MCYTSGTTGNPKGVVYSHRSNVLHSMMASAPDAMGISSRDVVLPIVPMFHANCWGLALTSPMMGAAMVMPGAKLDGASIYEVLNDYEVTVCHAWGMTEMSPLGTLGSLKPEYAALGTEERLDVQMKQGHPPFGVD